MKPTRPTCGSGKSQKGKGMKGNGKGKSMKGNGKGKSKKGKGMYQDGKGKSMKGKGGGKGKSKKGLWRVVSGSGIYGKMRMNALRVRRLEARAFQTVFTRGLFRNNDNAKCSDSGSKSSMAMMRSRRGPRRQRRDMMQRMERANTGRQFNFKIVSKPDSGGATDPVQGFNGALGPPPPAEDDSVLEMPPTNAIDLSKRHGEWGKDDLRDIGG